MRKLAKRIGLALAIIAAALVVVALATARLGDRALYPPAGASYARILVTHNGYHSSVLLPRAAVAELAGRRGHGALIAVTTRLAAYRWLAIGWREAEVYLNVT